MKGRKGKSRFLTKLMKVRETSREKLLLLVAYSFRIRLTKSKRRISFPLLSLFFIIFFPFYVQTEL